jgi:DNA-binding response OmpR family regulator
MRTLRLLNQIPAQKFVLTEAVSVAAGIEAVKKDPYDCILLDFRLPDGDAIDVLKGIDAAKGNCPPVILQTVMDDEEKALETVARGAQDYLVKGRFDSTQLVRAIRYAIQRDRLAKERNRLAAELLAAQQKIQTLEGLLPICSFCKKIRDREDNNKWVQMEKFVSQHSKANFSHGVCPECAKRNYGIILKPDKK